RRKAWFITRLGGAGTCVSARGACAAACRARDWIRQRGEGETAALNCLTPSTLSPTRSRAFLSEVLSEGRHAPTQPAGDASFCPDEMCEVPHTPTWANRASLIPKIPELARPRRQPKALGTPTQCPGPFRASRALAPTHVGRREVMLGWPKMRSHRRSRSARLLRTPLV